jgi:membrane protease YdiL (CAAX protease family)
MSRFVLIWEKMPVMLKAIITGIVVATAGTTPWAALVSLNLKYGTEVPWSVPITAIYLWFFWKYLNGSWWPQSTAEKRKSNCRAKFLNDEILGVALVAGSLGLGFILSFQALLSRMVTLPVQANPDLSHIPLVTLLFFVLMSAVVAGVAEEAAFRGYMQRPLELRHGPLIAILVVGLAFGFAHFSHTEVTILLMPYYLVVSAVYGMLAYLTDSIIPSLLLHAGGNLLSAFSLLMQGNVRTPSVSKSPLIWQTGTDVKFWITCLFAFVIGAITIWSYKMLAGVTAKHKAKAISNSAGT